MRQSARDSILSLPRNGNMSNRSSTMYSEDSHTHIVTHAATKASGLRQQYYDDNTSTEYDEGLMMRPTEHRQDGRF
jgi:hypothetical protein